MISKCRKGILVTRGPFIESPGNFSGPPPFLVDGYLKIKKCIRPKLPA